MCRSPGTKNVQNVFAVKPIQEHTSNKFELDINKFVTSAAVSIAKGTDVNTAIRKASENIAKEIERQKRSIVSKDIKSRSFLWEWPTFSLWQF
jgi:hypothetical protein